MRTVPSRVRVTAAPADGAANKAVLKLLAKTLSVPRSAVTLVSGATQPPQARAHRWRRRGRLCWTTGRASSVTVR